MGNRLAAAGVLLAGLALAVIACVGDDPTPTTPGAGSSGATSGVVSAAYSIRCGTSVCTGSDVCCTTTQGGSIASTTCTPKAQCATTYLECDSTHECPAGLRCCANTNGGSYDWASSACSAACTVDQRQLCDEADECDGGCVANPAPIRPPNLRACPQ